MHKYILGAGALLCAALLSLSATTKYDTATGTFNANMKLGAQSSSPMAFDGKLAWSKPKLRLDLTEKQTKEKMVVLVDFKGGAATLLYPDTLNGFKTSLPALDSSGYITQLESLLSTGGKTLPKGWTRTKVASEKLGGKAATKYKVTGPKGEVVHWWVDSADAPLRVEAGSGSKKMDMNFTALKFGADVPAKTFTYGKDYTVVEFTGKPKQK